MTKAKWGTPQIVTHDQLLDILTYDPVTGEFWRNGKTYKANCKEGYVQIRIFNRLYYGHHLAWFYIHKEWAIELDHIDRNRSNNRIHNLRKATRSQNLINASLRTDNVSGHTGVAFALREGKWRARINKDGIETHIGYFFSREEAIAARRKVAMQLYGEFAEDIAS